jgi:hypothetical protein
MPFLPFCPFPSLLKLPQKYNSHLSTNSPAPYLLQIIQPTTQTIDITRWARRDSANATTLHPYPQTHPPLRNSATPTDIIRKPLYLPGIPSSQRYIHISESIRLVPKTLIMYAKEEKIDLLTHDDCTDILSCGTTRDSSDRGRRAPLY